MNTTYLEATQEAGKAFYQRQIQGPVVMLNLLRFRSEADYSTLPDIKPSNKITGEEAFQRYMKHTLPFLETAGSEVLFYGKGGTFLIGPEHEKWDAALLVKHASVNRFMTFAQEPDYQKIAGHRTAALEDSRLLPLTASSLNF